MFYWMLNLAAAITIYGSLRTANAQSPDCRGMSGLIPHPTSCQRYTDCSKGSSSYGFSRLFKDQELECPYPQLFDIVDRRCKSFKNAECGPGRESSKEPCEYLNNQCGSAHCEPCSSRLPSCVGLTNGIYAHPTKYESFFFMECNMERTVGIRLCPWNVPTNSANLFSPDKPTCTSLWKVSTEPGEPEPSCEGREARMYAVTNRPFVYYTCPGSHVYYCQHGKFFNEVAQECQ